MTPRGGGCLIFTFVFFKYTAKIIQYNTIREVTRKPGLLSFFTKMRFYHFLIDSISINKNMKYFCNTPIL